MTQSQFESDIQQCRIIAQMLRAGHRPKPETLVEFSAAIERLANVRSETKAVSAPAEGDKD